MIYLYIAGIIFLTIALLLTILVALLYFGLVEKIQISTGSSPFPFAGAEIAYKAGKGKSADAAMIFTEACSIIPRKATVGIYLGLEPPEQQTQLIDDECDTNYQLLINKNNKDNTKSTNKLTTTSSNIHRSTVFGSLPPDFDPVSGEYHFIVGVITTHGSNYKPEHFATATCPSDDVNRPVTESERKLFLEKGFKFVRLPATENVVYATFPFRGIVSIAIGIRRVYSVMSRYIKVVYD